MAVWLLISTISPGIADAKLETIIDIDGSATWDRGPNAAWRTPWRMKRVERHTAFQQHPSEGFRDGDKVYAMPEWVDVSYAEYNMYRHLWAKADDQQGPAILVDLLPDPLQPKRLTKLVPGWYRVSKDVTFMFHRPGEKGVSYLRKQQKDALERERLTRGRLQSRGPAFPLIRAQTARRKRNAIHGVDGLHFLTYRHELDKHAQGWLDDLAEAREIGYSVGENADGEPLRASFTFLNAPEGLLNNGPDMPMKKAEDAHARARALLSGAEEKHLDYVTNPRGAEAGEMALMHTIIVAEDDPRNIVALGNRLRELSHEKDFPLHIKFVLFNVGAREDVIDGPFSGPDDAEYFPRRFTVFHDGFPRAATKAEVALWIGSDSEATCEAMLLGEPAEKKLVRRRG